MKRLVPAVAAVAIVAAVGAGSVILMNGDGSDPSTTPPTPIEKEPVPKSAYLKDACELPPEWVRLIARGWRPGGARDLDLIVVPHPPNWSGSPTSTSHSGPYDFLQEVPLVLYGPGFIRTLGHTTLDRDVTIADLAPTYAALLNFDEWPRRRSAPMTEILKPTDRVPKVIVTAVIDGGGWNALKEWPETWPNIAGLIEDGVNVDAAIVGSSPSITPATHTSLATGTFPRYHGVTAIVVRADDGDIVGAFARSPDATGAEDMDPTVSLRVPTLADLWDRAQKNRPKVGMLAATNLQMGMIGHGAGLRGGDKDIAVILAIDRWATTPEFYSLPDYVNLDVPGPEGDINAVDRLDGKVDGEWLGHAIAPIEGTPAFAPWENRTIEAILEREDFGRDDVADLFYLNYKAPDKAGHIWNMINPEQRDVLISVDTAIGELKKWLDDNIGPRNYVFTVTADHGQTPLGQGGWPLARGEMLSDLAAQFGKGIVSRTALSTYFTGADAMAAAGVTPEKVASFISRYTIGDNIPAGASVPEGFAARTDERIFDAVFPGRKLPEVMACTGVAGPHR